MKHVATAGDYTRSALKRGLAIEARIGINPYKFGMIGSTDSHSGMSSAEEDNFWGKMGMDSIPENTFDPEMVIVPPSGKGIDMGAAGLAAVWAEENTRGALFDAFKRKETYATTGPRLRVRFFGGWDFDKEDAHPSILAESGYKKGVPMGSDLSKAVEDKSPAFLIQAIKDPNHANLDRIQVIKGWVDEKGMPHEKIYKCGPFRRPERKIVRQNRCSKKYSRPEDRHMDRHSRRCATGNRMDRPGFRSESERILLYKGIADSYTKKFAL